MLRSKSLYHSVPFRLHNNVSGNFRCSIFFIANTQISFDVNDFSLNFSHVCQVREATSPLRSRDGEPVRAFGDYSQLRHTCHRFTITALNACFPLPGTKQEKTFTTHHSSTFKCSLPIMFSSFVQVQLIDYFSYIQNEVAS